MKTKILELIDKKRKAYITNIYDQRNLTITVCMFDNFIEELRQEIEKMEEWIPVTERLPQHRTHVLISMPSGQFYGFYNQNSKLWSLYTAIGIESNTSFTKEITHWLHRPLPPNTFSHE